MQYYNDEENKSGARVVFMVIQMMVLAMVYIFVYTSFIVVGLAIEQKSASVWMYFPVLMALLIFPILLYKYRQMFHKGKMLVAFTWMMGAASLTIILLYAYIAQITS